MQCVCNYAECDTLERYLTGWEGLFGPYYNTHALNRMISETPSWNQIWPRLRSIFWGEPLRGGGSPDVSCQRLCADATRWLRRHRLVETQRVDNVCLIWEATRARIGLRRSY